MARLHEYQGKAILAANGFKIPRGRIVGAEAEEDFAGVVNVHVVVPQKEACRPSGQSRKCPPMNSKENQFSVNRVGSKRQFPISISD